MQQRGVHRQHGKHAEGADVLGPVDDGKAGQRAQHEAGIVGGADDAGYLRADLLLLELQGHQRP
jgi:hypothetical protein